MRLSYLFACLGLSLLPFVQPQATTSLIILETTGSDQLIGTVTTSTVFTIGSTSASSSTITSNSASATGNTTTSPSSQGNATSVTPSNLPTAPTAAAGANGGGPDGNAPSPGASASGGLYGPPDGYIAAAEALRSAAALGGVGFVVGVVVTFM